eukprot:Tbor_TRINITY_DN2582_c0_g1::TRINITY_DN2582_c0_g1_i1::g.553::m.553
MGASKSTEKNKINNLNPRAQLPEGHKPSKVPIPAAHHQHPSRMSHQRSTADVVSDTTPLSEQPVAALVKPSRTPIRLTKEAIAMTAGNFLSPPLGKGGFSTVYPGYFYGNPVAVKVLNIRNASERAMFDDELRALLNPVLWHPNVCPLLGYCDTDPAFIFPLMTPMTIERMSRLPDDVKDTICVNICKGLEHMHRAGYVHSDMKPDNVLLEFDANRMIKTAYVGDLGCVKSCSVAVIPFGTIVFLDPQLPLNIPRLPHPVDDVYSLGITFLSIWTNRIPESAQEIAEMKMLLADNDTARSDCVAAMTHSVMSARPTCEQVAKVLSDLQQKMWRERAYPWSSGITPNPRLLVH